MKKPFLLIIDGMTGAGKTTITNLLSKKISRLAIIGMDRIKWFISDFERCERDNKIAKDIVFEMTKKYLDHKISVVIEQPFKSEEELLRYKKIAKKYSVPIYKIQLFTSPKIALKRVLHRQKNRERKVPEARIKRNISLFKNKKDEGFLVINTSNLSRKKTLEEILKLIRS